MDYETWLENKIKELQPQPSDDVAQYNYRLGAYHMAMACAEEWRRTQAKEPDDG